ncbi:type I-B CRISPR-associated protein Cas5b [Thermosyntropha sp.]|uniref:type I-B CRISPR-associated protein Cas5b n=1 Tax=Thermosyntropha sp. TaxID=2740820 RepID=UPI0025F840E3|nr:type I-B CRISPR-associated protein Cas5b [Thermosyntropha sp.]MBO8159472.1 type I-B CRISPR-associated protein Cas5 [Thermosyntropha sp.]
MQVIIFDLTGCFAHFRKIYTNSSSLSYSLPPRTTVAGIIAAILGLERDSYYEILSSQNLDIAVGKINPTRKLVQSLNYMKITTSKHFVYPDGHTQIPFEIICGDPEIRYRIYARLADKTLYHDLQKRLIDRRCVFPPYLGAAPFAAHIEYIGEGELKGVDTPEIMTIVTPVDINLVEKLDFNQFFDDSVLVKDKMPVDFTPERYPINTRTYLYEDKGKGLRVKLKNAEACHKVVYSWDGKNLEDNIVFY